MGKVVGLEGCCETSPVLIGELINGGKARTWKKPRVPCDCTAVHSGDRDTICSYNHEWLSRRGFSMTGADSVHRVTGEKINTKCTTQWVSLLIIMINLRFSERSVALPYLPLWISCSYKWGKINCKTYIQCDFCQLAGGYVGVKRLAPSTGIHRCSPTQPH